LRFSQIRNPIEQEYAVVGGELRLPLPCDTERRVTVPSQMTFEPTAALP